MDLDPGMVTALRAAWAERETNNAERFTVTEELLAQILEMLSIIRVEAQALSGYVKQADLSEPLRVPRPGDEIEPVDPVRVVSPREFALMMQVG
jgi:hypothetical protein